MKKTHVVLHHSFTPDSGAVSWGAMRRYHTSWKYDGRIVTEAEARDLRSTGKHVEPPWRDIAYHIGVELIGDHYEVLMGRAIDEDGAHAYQQGMNRIGLGVIFVGNFDEVEPPKDMLLTMARHLRPLMALLGIPSEPERVIPHRQVAPYKTCPGRLFPVQQFISFLRP